MIDYKARYDKIKPFVTFRINARKFKTGLSLAEKQKISYHFNILFGAHGTAQELGLIQRDIYIYRPRSAENKRKMARYLGITGNYSEFAALPVPRGNPEIPLEFDFRGEYVRVKEGSINRQVVLFDPVGLAKDTEKEVRRALKAMPHAKRVGLMSGLREMNKKTVSDDLDFVVNLVVGQMMRYENWREWLKGLTGYSFEDQASVNEYLILRKKGKRNGRKKRPTNRSRG